VTTALLWWAALLGITWGVVAAVRSRRWSADQDDPSELRTRDLGARLALLPVVVLLALVAFVSFTFLGWTSSPPGWARVRESLPALGVVALTGLGAVACVLTIAGRRVRSWWLVSGLLPALVGTAALLGV
jgi:hypothetical protein